ncbi:MAG: hypothetical protein ABF633_13080 [Clostridium sp.]|uniref:glycan biosynthesis hexose transferase WsfD n=1 Tax=Clostridium sp. TaxID=1506 RepID=UPI0039EC7414
MTKIMEKIKYIKNNYLIEIIIVTIMAIILVNTLFISPIVGKVDNGDFGRLMCYGGLDNVNNEYSKIYDKFLHTKYLIANPGIFAPVYINWVSVSILLKAAVLLCLTVNDFNSNVFDIRYLAFVYCVAFLIGIFFIVSFKKFSPILKMVAGAFIIMFFTSACYITYFNSFFGEAGTIVFFFLNIGTYLYLITRKHVSTRHFVYFFIASGGFLTAKSQNVPLLIFMLIIYAGLYVNYKQKKFRKNIIIGTLIVIVVCCISYFSLSSTMNENNIYQSVFSGVLRGSENPAKDLQELGVDKKFMVFYGHSFYDRKNGHDPMGKDMLEEFYPKVSFTKVLGFYIKHPDRLWQKIVDSADNAYDFSGITKSNFIKGQYDPNKKINNFRLKLIKKFPKLHRNIFIFIAFSSIYLGVLIFYFVREKSTRLLDLMLLFILASGASQLVLPVIGSGHGDFGKHLFLLNLSYDIMAGIAVLWVVHIISAAVIKIKQKLSCLMKVKNDN